MEKENQDKPINSLSKIFWDEETKKFSELIRNNKLARTADQAFVVKKAYPSHFDALSRHLVSSTHQRCEEVSELVPISMSDKDFKDDDMKMIRIAHKNAKMQIPNFRISDTTELIIDEGDSDLLR
ncbi:MAG: hypothetical protein EZS28_027215 [Streblomastix strix]|uniref:Uncharacterized protein n=1 Tax=Streblomastix strix TaxID=222440 RepID=A0A5J4V3R6_9EUKA|nr:MAG: hypothetical protein EZS28_027215 [Streblomastix strix]